MNKNKAKRGIIIIGIFCLLGVVGYFVRQNSHVRFKDENMGIVICNTIGHGVTPETVRYKDLKRVITLDTSFLGYYTTLVDIEKCRNIETLILNDGCTEDEPCYMVTHNVAGEKMSDGKIQLIEMELERIIPQLANLSKFSFMNYESNCDIQNWGYIAECNALDEINIKDSVVTDYSFLSSLKNMRMINLWGSQVSTADSLINLQDPKRLCIYDTPLAENEEEIKKLCEALPNTEILISGDRVENEQHWDWSEYYN